MKVMAVFGTSAAFLFLFYAQSVASAQSSVPPAAPQGRAPQATPPAGTQDDRQIPDSGNTRNAPATNSQPGSQVEKGTSGAESTSAKSSFGERLALKSLSEMQLGQLAQSNTTNSDIRNLGRMMVDDHSRIYSEIKSLLQNNGLSVASAPDSGSQAVYERLSRLSGDVFDREFIAQVVNELKQTTADYQRESAGTDVTWRRFAIDNLRILQQELETAEMLMQSRTKGEATPVRRRPNRPALASVGAPSEEQL